MCSLTIQVFGANTDVGKTVISAGLLRAASNRPLRRRTTYIKPLQTGKIHDGLFVQRYTSADVSCHTLYSWETPLSPHVAAAKEGKTISSEKLLGLLRTCLQQAQESHTVGGDEGGVRQREGSSVGDLVVVETAGGVLSPGPSPLQTQADLYRPLRLPVLLVGDGRLGGISSTLAAYESLYCRGYEVYAIAVLEVPHYIENAAAVSEYITGTLGHAETPVLSLPHLPEVSSVSFSTGDVDEDVLSGGLDQWYHQHEHVFHHLLDMLIDRERVRIQRLQKMTTQAAQVFWYPFTQHSGLSGTDLHVVDSAYGDNYTLIRKSSEDGDAKEHVPCSRTLIDACASWWTQGLGHGRVDVALAVGAAAGRFGHVIFPGNVHEPALRLAELMLAGPGQGWASRVFFSDNGSTAMEIAVKMALKKNSVDLKYEKGCSKEEFRVEEPNDKISATPLTVVTQRDCYHGDTLGCMDAAAPTIFNTGQHPWYQPRTLSLTVPTFGYVSGHLQVEIPPEIIRAAGQSALQPPDSGQVLKFPGGLATLLDVHAREGSDAAVIYRKAIRAQFIAFERGEEGILSSNTVIPLRGEAGQGRRCRRLGAVLLEPVLMGAAGMVMVDPLFQRILTLEGRAYGLPVVFDEIASGLYRLGCASAAELLGVAPDIACYGKTLTGGYLPMALTLTTEAVFEAFHGTNKSDALLHGHSYTANPLGCAAAVHALKAYAVIHETNIRTSQECCQRKEDFSPNKNKCSSHHNICRYNEDQVAALSNLSGVRRAVALGTVLAVELKEVESSNRKGYSSTASTNIVKDLREAGIYARPLGNVVYLIASQVSSGGTFECLVDTLDRVLRRRGETLGKFTHDMTTSGVVI